MNELETSIKEVDLNISSMESYLNQEYLDASKPSIVYEGLLGKIWNGIKNFFKFIIKAVVKLWKILVRFFSNLWNRMKSAFNKLFRKNKADKDKKDKKEITIKSVYVDSRMETRPVESSDTETSAKIYSDTMKNISNELNKISKKRIQEIKNGEKTALSDIKENFYPLKEKVEYFNKLRPKENVLIGNKEHEDDFNRLTNNPNASEELFNKIDAVPMNKKAEDTIFRTAISAIDVQSLINVLNGAFGDVTDLYNQFKDHTFGNLSDLKDCREFRTNVFRQNIDNKYKNGNYEQFLAYDGFRKDEERIIKSIDVMANIEEEIKRDFSTINDSAWDAFLRKLTKTDGEFPSFDELPIEKREAAIKNYAQELYNKSEVLTNSLKMMIKLNQMIFRVSITKFDLDEDGYIGVNDNELNRVINSRDFKDLDFHSHADIVDISGRAFTQLITQNRNRFFRNNGTMLDCRSLQIGNNKHLGVAIVFNGAEQSLLNKFEYYQDEEVDMSNGIVTGHKKEWRDATAPIHNYANTSYNDMLLHDLILYDLILISHGSEIDFNQLPQSEKDEYMRITKNSNTVAMKKYSFKNKDNELYNIADEEPTDKVWGILPAYTPRGDGPFRSLFVWLQKALYEEDRGHREFEKVLLVVCNPGHIKLPLYMQLDNDVKITMSTTNLNLL